MATMASCVGAVVLLLVVAGPGLSSAAEYKYRHMDKLPARAHRDSVDGIVFHCSRQLSECASDHLRLDKSCTLIEKVSKTTALDTVARRYDVWCAGFKVRSALVTLYADKDGTTTYALHFEPAALTTFKPRLPLAKLADADALSMAAAEFKISAANYRAYGKDHDVSRVWQYDDRRFRLCALASFGYDVPGNLQHPHILVDIETKQVIDRWDGIGHQGSVWHLDFEIPSVPVRIITAVGNPGTTGYKTNVDVLTYGNISQDCVNTTLPPKYVIQTFDNTNTIQWTSSVLVPYEMTDCTSYLLFENCVFTPYTDVMWADEFIRYMYGNYTGSPPTPNQITYQVLQGPPNSLNAGTYISGSTQKISFGAGGPTTPFKSLTTPDIVAHEVSHIFTFLHSALPYSGQSYGINEGYSDIAGQALLYFLLGSCDYCVAGQAARVPGHCLRYMCDPPKDGSSIAHISQYSNGMDGHYSSGLLNKPYCLLSKSAGYNCVTAWLPFLYANVLRWNTGSTFVSAACNVYTSARLNLGYNSTMLQSIKTSFAAVGIIIGSSC